MSLSKVVVVTTGRVRDEISQVVLGRWPEAKDGTWKWEIVAPRAPSRLIPIAVSVERPSVLHIPEEGLYEVRG